MEKWAHDPDEHVRRLASEGSRPRSLGECGSPPSCATHLRSRPILEPLKADPSLYVRKSVANHLNDITKDHPAWVIERVSGWDRTDAGTAWIVKHALRTLIKRAIRPPRAPRRRRAPKLASNASTPPRDGSRLGGRLTLVAELTSTARQTQSLAVDYVVHYVKASGRTAEKVFKWKVVSLAGERDAEPDQDDRSCTISRRGATTPENTGSNSRSTAGRAARAPARRTKDRPSVRPARGGRARRRVPAPPQLSAHPPWREPRSDSWSVAATPRTPRGAHPRVSRGRNDRGIPGSGAPTAPPSYGACTPAGTPSEGPPVSITELTPARHPPPGCRRRLPGRARWRRPCRLPGRLARGRGPVRLPACTRSPTATGSTPPASTTPSSRPGSGHGHPSRRAA